MKKFVALLLVVLQLLACTAAMAEYEDKLGGLTLPLTDKEVEITMYFGTQYEMTEDTWFFKKLYELTGVKVVPIVYTKDIAAEKFANFLASAELPDIFINSYVGDQSAVNEYGDQGAFAATNDYLDVMPNFKSIYIDNADNKLLYDNYASQETGNNYFMPIYGLNRDVNFGWLYRADVFEELGIETWTSTEEFVEVLRKLKAAYPDTYPLTHGGMPGRNHHYFDMNDYPVAYDYETGKYYISATSENFKEYLDLYKMLYNEGLLDPEFLTNSTDAWTARMLNGQSFVSEHWIGRMALLNTQAAEATPGFDLAYTRPIGNGKMMELSKFSQWGAMVANNENTEISMKVVDFLYSDLGSELMTLGLEGDNFSYDENGKLVYKDINEEPNINNLEEVYGMWIEGLYLRPSKKSCYYAYTDHEQYAQDLINNECGYIKPFLNPVLGTEDQAAFDTLRTEFKTKTEAFYAEYITNSAAGEAEWNNWVETAMKDYGDAILAILNK